MMTFAGDDHEDNDYCRPPALSCGALNIAQAYGTNTYFACSHENGRTSTSMHTHTNVFACMHKHTHARTHNARTRAHTHTQIQANACISDGNQMHVCYRSLAAP